MTQEKNHTKFIFVQLSILDFYDMQSSISFFFKREFWKHFLEERIKYKKIFFILDQKITHCKKLSNCVQKFNFQKK